MTRARRDGSAEGELPAPGVASVLLVDDRPENLLALDAILEPLGHRLVHAASGEEALRHVLQEQFAVILLDVEMPGTNGHETARLIKRRTRSEHVPIIFLTALREDRRQVTLGYESGAVDYLFKPLDPDLLRAKVAAFVELDQLREALAEQQGRRFADLAVRESEERFRLVQKATNDVIWDWDLVTDGLRWNELASSVFAVPWNEIPDDVRWWFDHIHPDDRTRVETGIQTVIDAGDGAAWSAEYRFRLGDGSYRMFLDRGYVVRDADGQEAVRMIGAMQDVTERVQAREDAAAAQADAESAREAAEAASRVKSEFLATMSHEFRTPLNAIIGYAQILDMGILGPATPAQHAHLDRLQASAHHLLRLVNDVLDVAKVDADRLDVCRDALFTRPAVTAAMDLVQPLATAKGVVLTDAAAEGNGVPYLGDEHRVRQALVNLLSNAIKFTPAGGRVTVSCGTADMPEPGIWRAVAESGTASSGHEPMAFIRVEDTGPGIAQGLLDHLFEPFIQGDSALTREHGGTGLGLAISRRLARLMGGDIVVRSELGRGASFTLWLPGSPLADDAPVADASVSEDPRSAASVAEPQDGPLDAATFAVLRALSGGLATDAEIVSDRYVAALRADQRFPRVLELTTAELRDHVTPFVGLLASQLTIIAETSGEARNLLSDGGEVQRVMSELHGAQRHRLGWSEADVEREVSLLLAELVGAIRGGAARTLEETSAGTIRRATAYAENVARHMLERASRTALRALRFAKSTSPH